MNVSHTARLAASGLFLSAMALALSACGGSDNSPAASTPTTPTTPTTPVVAANQLYTETNETANMVVHMVRNADGSITIKNRVASGGTGLNGVAVGTTALAPDSTGSQHSVIVSADKTLLFAVNAGDSTVSVFAIDQSSGDLTLKKSNKTLGSTPTSLAVNNGVLYVLFQTGSNQVGAYTVQADGTLAQIGLYAAPGAMAPTQIVVSPDASYLVASTGPGSNAVLSYPMNKDGSLGTPVTNTTATATLANPFAGAFVNAALYLETDVTNKGIGSYSFSNTGLLKQISAVTVGEGAPCWMSITPDGKTVFVGNGAGTVSSLSIDINGKLTLINAKAASEPSAIAGVNPVAADSFVSADGKFLYVAYLGDDKVVSYSISGGTLTKLNEQVIGTATKQSLQGLAGF